MPDVSFTMLNAMADGEFEPALDRHVAWGLKHLDLKGGILGKDVIRLTEDEAHSVQSLIGERELSVYCMSTTLFDEFVEEGADTFRADHLGKVDQAIQVAKALRPHFLRLLAAKSRKRSETADSVSYLKRSQPWVIEMYREAIQKVTDAGFLVTIENECHDCLFSRTDEILGFFQELNCGDAVNLTWDVQNLWQMGTFPSIEVYEQLKPLIQYYHVKGGQAENEGGPLRWRSSLEDASWPVREITECVVTDGISPVICLNGSHGERKAGYDYDNVTERDLKYMDRLFGEES